MKQLKTIDQVIIELDEIIQESIDTSSPLGYFAALYRSVTVKVKEGIAENFFEDGPRMERLDVIFASRYIDAYRGFQNGKPITASWQIAFDAASNKNLIVLQHLLLGMNAHINLDLGIAAVEVMDGKNMEGLKVDFDRINTILSELVGKVQNDLAEIWPKLRLILKLTGRADDFLVDFSMKLARNGAWKFATELAETPQKDQPEFIVERDQKVARKAQIVLYPGFLVVLIFRVIRLFERGNVKSRIDALMN